MKNQKIVSVTICRYLRKSTELTQLERISYNGPAVWLVAGCVAVAWFLQKSR